MIAIKSPCSICPLWKHVDLGCRFCMNCPARAFYADAVVEWYNMSHREQKAAVKHLRAIVPTLAQYNKPRKITQKKTLPAPIDYNGRRPKLKLESFRAFYVVARAEGFKDIKEWLESDYMEKHNPGKYFLGKVGCTQPTFIKVLTTYGMPRPANHNKSARMEDLDVDRVNNMLTDKVPMRLIASDQGCSVGLINQFKRDNGFRIKQYR